MIEHNSKLSTRDRPLDEFSEVYRRRTTQDKKPLVGQVLRRAREHHRLSLREVERRIGRSNAYLSQVERGLIKQPDLVVLLELAELYGLNFSLLANWANWVSSGGDSSEDTGRYDSTTILVHKVMELDAEERIQVLDYVEGLLRKRWT